MIWFAIYLIGMYVTMAILSWRNGIVDGAYEMFILLICSCIWPLVIMLWLTNLCFKLYRKIKNL